MSDKQRNHSIIVCTSDRQQWNDRVSHWRWFIHSSSSHTVLYSYHRYSFHSTTQL